NQDNNSNKQRGTGARSGRRDREEPTQSRAKATPVDLNEESSSVKKDETTQESATSSWYSRMVGELRKFGGSK
ncbi:hypothetical protein BBJ28_00023380, partial [Nothophytophthora sp. Chile5]